MNMPPPSPPPYKRSFWRNLGEFVRTIHRIVWVAGMFVGIPFVIIPVLGWIPQVRATFGYCAIWGLTISFVLHLVNDLQARGILSW